jgi:metal-responsive CopG/Arc/MetJ family transcriptional regulator
MRREKCLAEVKLRLDTKLIEDLQRLGAEKGFDGLSPFIRQILRQHLHGHFTTQHDITS